MARKPQNQRAGRRVKRHYIVEWADVVGMRQVDIADRINVDKGTVSRWFSGQLPQENQQLLLAQCFGIPPESLLRHPDVEWMSRFFAGRPADEIDRIKKTMETGWPKADPND